MDGAALVDTSSEPTLVIGQTRPTVTAPTAVVKKKRTGMWVGLSLIGIVVLALIVAGLMFAAYRMGTKSANGRDNTNSSTTSRTAATPTPSPAVSATKASDETPVPSPSSDTASNSEEPTPISWTTSPNFVKTDAGLRASFECPPEGTAGTVWGSDVYTTDSSVCTAAVHAGKITFEKGGVVTVEFKGGRQTYGATTRNGVTTYNFGQFPNSFVFVDASAPAK